MDDFVEKLNAIAIKAASSTRSKERADIRSVLLRYLNTLIDKDIKGFQFDWVEGSMHCRASIVVENSLQTAIYCLHPSDDDCPFSKGS